MGSEPCFSDTPAAETSAPSGQRTALDVHCSRASETSTRMSRTLFPTFSGILATFCQTCPWCGSAVVHWTATSSRCSCRDGGGSAAPSNWMREIDEKHLSPVIKLKLVPPRPRVAIVGVGRDGAREPIAGLLDLALAPEQSRDGDDNNRRVVCLLERVDGP